MVAAQPPDVLAINQDHPGLELLSERPPAYLLHDFLDDEACAALIAAAYPQLEPSFAGLSVGAGRTSEGCELSRETPAATTLLLKIRHLLGVQLERIEDVTVSRYASGQRYDGHYDSPAEGEPGADRFLASGGGHRIATVLVYLNSVASGGQTAFPRAGLEVPPRRGAALVFFPATLAGQRDDMAWHQALPAHDTKWVAQVWVRQRRAADPLLHSMRTVLDGRYPPLSDADLSTSCRSRGEIQENEAEMNAHHAFLPGAFSLPYQTSSLPSNDLTHARPRERSDPSLPWRSHSRPSSAQARA